MPSTLLFSLLLALLPAPARPFYHGVHFAVAPALHQARRAAMPAAGVSRESGRRPSRVGQVVRAELATVIRTANSVGSKRIPAGLQSMIQLAQRNRLMDKDLRSEFNLNVASQNGELAFEQYRSLVSQMKQIVFISDDKLGDIILAEGEVSTLEKSIYDQLTAQKAGAISA
jgi:hypothetical protein